MRVRGDRQPGQQAMGELLSSGAYRTVPAAQRLPDLPGYPILPGQASGSDLFLSYKGLQPRSLLRYVVGDVPHYRDALRYAIPD